MKLLSFFSKNKKAHQTIEQFIALQIGTHHSKAAIWANKDDEVVIKTVVNGLTPEEVIRKATEKFQVSEVLFGLPSEYITDDKIKEDRLPRLKRIVKSFSLKPIGFVVVSEAIAHLIESEQDSPPTAIFVNISSDILTFSLFRVGKPAGTYRTPRTENLINDFETGLAQFTSEEVLPSKIIIDNEDTALPNLKEELLNYPWQDNEKFLHVPKIELLPWEYSIEAVIQAGVSEMDDAFEESRDATKTSAASFGFTTEAEPNTVAKEPTTAVSHEVVTVKSNTSPPTSRLSNLKMPSLPSPSNFSLPMPRGLLPVGIASAILLIVGIGGAVYAYPTATITLLAEPDVIEDEVTIKLNTNSTDINVGQGEIPGKVHSVTVSSSKTGDASGTKIIGEKATGKVVIYNKSLSAKTFPKGTVISTSGVSFTLNDEVKVASASDTGESLEYGKKSASATALEIGPNGNIESNVELEIEDIPASVAIAKSEEKFSGGTEREINVVSEDDQDKLVLGVSDELKNDAREQLNAQIGSDEKFLDESMSENIVEKAFDTDIGEESDTVTLELVLEISQTSYTVDNINRFLEGYMKEQIKEGFTLDTKKSFFRVIDSKEDDDGNISFIANYYAFLIPDISLDGFKDDLSGISTKRLESLVRELTDQRIVGYEIKQTRSLPFLDTRLPFLKSNIDVEVKVYE